MLTPELIRTLEKHEAVELSSLAAYVQALGGCLEVAVVFGVRRYPLDLSVAALASVEPDAPADEL